MNFNGFKNDYNKNNYYTLSFEDNMYFLLLYFLQDFNFFLNRYIII